MRMRGVEKLSTSVARLCKEEKLQKRGRVNGVSVERKANAIQMGGRLVATAGRAQIGN
jgi:hypothetical protein